MGADTIGRRTRDGSAQGGLHSLGALGGNGAGRIPDVPRCCPGRRRRIGPLQPSKNSARCCFMPRTTASTCAACSRPGMRPATRWPGNYRPAHRGIALKRQPPAGEPGSERHRQQGPRPNRWSSRNSPDTPTRSCTSPPFQGSQSPSQHDVCDASGALSRRNVFGPPAASSSDCGQRSPSPETIVLTGRPAAEPRLWGAG